MHFMFVKGEANSLHINNTKILNVNYSAESPERQNYIQPSNLM